MIRDRKGKPGDDHIGKRFTRNVHSLPEAIRSKQHRVDVILELFEHERTWRAGALNKTRDAELIEKRLQDLSYLEHQFEISKKNKCFSVGLPDEMLYPLFKRIAITIFARVWHLIHHK